MVLISRIVEGRQSPYRRDHVISHSGACWKHAKGVLKHPSGPPRCPLELALAFDAAKLPVKLDFRTRGMIIMV